MPERVSSAKRVKLQNVAEREIMRYAGDHYLWHKHVHNVELDAMQILKFEAMDRHDKTIDFSCRRTGKTASKEMWDLEYNACNPDQELGVVAPREAQAIVNLDYHLEAIRRSPILSAYIAYKAGRQQLGDTRYQLCNRSMARSYGIMAQVDGGDLTVASLEEVDDMPRDRLYSRFLLMLGSTRRLGASAKSRNEPKVRITGVFKGASTLSDMIASGDYHVLPTVDVHLGIEMGIINRQFMLEMRAQLSPEEYMRQLACKNISSRNLIWETWLREAIQRGVRTRMQIEEPMPGVERRKRGLVAFGYDAGGHGENPDSSRHCLVVWELILNYYVPIYVRYWPAGADEGLVKDDLRAYWRYFQPDYAQGDAYGVGMMTQLNDELFRDGLTTTDRRAVGDGDSTASTWSEWPFSPLRFEGMTKHIMAQRLRTLFRNSNIVIPYIDDDHRDEPAIRDMRTFQQQLTNVVAEPTSKEYSSYKMSSRQVGDDGFDAGIVGLNALDTRGLGVVRTAIAHQTRTEADLLRDYNMNEAM